MIPSADQRISSGRSGNQEARGKRSTATAAAVQLRVARPATASEPPAATRGTAEGSVTPTLRRLVQGAWRRRFLIIVPVLLMIPISIAGALILPRTYVARTLLLLHENVRENPLGRAISNPEPIQRRVADVEALMKSESVLSKVIRDVVPADERMSPRQVAIEIRELQRALSVELAGSNFLLVELKGTRSERLGQELKSIISHLLEALLLNNNSISAAQLIDQMRSGEAEAAVQTLTRLKARLKEALPDGPEAASQWLQTANKQIADKRSALRATRSENAKVMLAGEIRGLEQDAEKTRRVLAEYASLNRQVQESEGKLASARGTLERFSNLPKTTGPRRGVDILDQPGRIEVIDPPVEPKLPTNSRLLFVLSSLAGSLLLGIALAWSAEILDPAIRSEHELAAATGVPVLGRLPRSVVSINHGPRARTSAGWSVRLLLALVLLLAIGTLGYWVASRPDVAAWANGKLDTLSTTMTSTSKNWASALTALPAWRRH